MSHFNYTLFPIEKKAKSACGIKKNEAYDFIIIKEKEKAIKYPMICTNYLYGCNCQSYVLYNNDFNITSNNDCNKLIKQELLQLLNDVQSKRQKLNDTLQKYPYGSMFDKSCARSGNLLKWSDKTFGICYILIFVWIWLIIVLLELILCYWYYCFLESRRVPATVKQIEEWFDSNISSNSLEFDAENVDNFIVERLQEICNNLNDKYSKFGICLKPFTYVDEVEVASYDEGGDDGGHVSRHNDYYDEFLIMNDDDNLIEININNC